MKKAKQINKKTKQIEIRRCYILELLARYDNANVKYFSRVLMVLRLVLRALK